jgi:hypothetical protein
LFKDLLSKFKEDKIFNWVTHESLLDNKEESDLTEEEKNEAWAKYEAEEKAKAALMAKTPNPSKLDDSENMDTENIDLQVPNQLKSIENLPSNYVQRTPTFKSTPGPVILQPSRFIQPSTSAARVYPSTSSLKRVATVSLILFY